MTRIFSTWPWSGTDATRICGFAWNFDIMEAHFEGETVLLAEVVEVTEAAEEDDSSQDLT